MAQKGTSTIRAGVGPAQARRELLRSPALVRGAERMVRLLLGALLSGGSILGGWSPFGVALVASAGAGSDGLCTLMGAGLGYLLFRGVAEGIRYAAACVLCFSVAFAFSDVKLLQRPWFMPLTAAGMDALTGFVYLSDSRWDPGQTVLFATEVLLAGVSAYCYALALSPWPSGWEGVPLSARQRVSLLFLLGSLLISLSGVELLGGLSLGRILSVLLVLAWARTGGPGRGAAAGVGFGLAMDLAERAAGTGSAPFYAVVYGFSGLLAGAGWRQGRLFGVLACAVSSSALVLWTWEETRLPGLYEVFLAGALFLLLPHRWLRQLSPLLEREGAEGTGTGAAAYAARRLEEVGQAFRSLRDVLRSALPPAEPNDGDPSTIFDRTADRVCRNCVLRNTCWEHDYTSTYSALNDALPALLEKGVGEAGDFPSWFTSRCLQFPAFLRTANEEVAALRYRRQYRARLQESRGTAARQYEALADVLSAVSAELSVELAPDPVRERRLRSHLAALDVEARAAVFYDAAGHLRVELEGEDLSPLETPGAEEALGTALGLPLRRGEALPGRAVFLQSEALCAVAGAAARRREGQSESGDTGTWFKREDGSLFVLLCDGMGSGSEARRESALAVRLLEELLRAGMDPVAALRAVNSTLALKNEEAGAFTTVDLLRLDLYTGKGELCKLGAAPTYLRKGGQVSRVAGASLPAGLADGESSGPDVKPLELGAGDAVLLISDGVAEAGEDGWLRELLKNAEGQASKDLARAVMEESEARVGPADDRTAVVIQLKKR